MARWRPYPWVLRGITAAALAVGLQLGRGVVRVEVGGRSMVPTLVPGERVVAVRWLAPRAGDVVAVVDPRVAARLLVKRVVAVHADGSVDVAGDDRSASTDSRTFGPVTHDLVIGRVVWRYWPPERRGRLHRRAPLFATGRRG